MNLPSTHPNSSYSKFYIHAVIHMLVLPIWLLASPLISDAGAQTKLEQQKDEGTIERTSPKKALVRGRVVYEDTRRPLRRVEVMIYDPANKSRGNRLMTWTNGRGEFQLKDVPAGKYFVMVTAPGIIRSDQFDPEAAQGDLTSITVDGNSQSDVVVRVKRGGAVSGKVTYADGDPVINAAIRVLRKKDTKWIPVYVGGRSTDRVLTDERGVFRISGLLPGEYLFGAAEEKLGIELTARDDPEGGRLLNRALQPATYYDGATSLSSATVLRVESGDEQTGINITLVERPVHSISGVISLKGENLPVARARIGLHRKDEELARGSDLEVPVVNTDDEGRFAFDEVYEGAYTITVTPPQEYSPYGFDQSALPNTNPPKQFVAKHIELNVADSDLTNVLIEVSSGRRVSGVVTVEGGKSLPRSIFVNLEPASGESRDQLSGSTQPDGIFTLEGIPSGRYYLRMAVPPNNEYYTKSVMHGRSDLTREPLAIKEDEDISNVRIVISADVARLSGRVLTADGKSPRRRAAILFVPVDSVEQKSMSRRMYGFTNADGGFRVSGAPGEYSAIVVGAGEGIYQLRGDDLISRAAKAQRITLQPGENDRIDLVLPSEK
jgi:protocatechuate 3,4-dioxygenase beta subunit